MDVIYICIWIDIDKGATGFKIKGKIAAITAPNLIDRIELSQGYIK